MGTFSKSLSQFATLVQNAGDAINLTEAAMMIARTEYPNLDIASQVARLKDIASSLPVNPTYPPHLNIQVLNKVLFEEEQFSGNDEEYDDPQNSYLNKVIERKKGIPISLSVIYLDVARRRGLPLAGVGFPGHFLVKYLADFEEILIDPYHGGVVLSLQDCAERLKANFGEEADLKPEHLEACPPKQILARMLNNLKGSYFRRRNYTKVLNMIELSLAIHPSSRLDIRDRGMVHFLMMRYREAMADFQTFLKLAPPNDPQTADVLQAMARIRGMVN